MVLLPIKIFPCAQCDSIIERVHVHLQLAPHTGLNKNQLSKYQPHFCIWKAQVLKDLAEESPQQA